MLFDAANPDSSTEKRTVSTVAPQALAFLNHPFVSTRAKRLGERLAAAAAGRHRAAIERAYPLLFARSVRPAELEVCMEFLLRQDASGTRPDWQGLAHLLLCSNEFIYVD